MNDNLYKELDGHQTSRQDIVDNAVFECITQCNPTDVPLEWDIALIGDVRDAVQKVFVDHLKICTEMEFYPYIEGEDYDPDPLP